MFSEISCSKGKIKCVKEHEDFLILDKPAGLACHGPEKENLAALLAEVEIEPFLCHRLDKETSGLIIVAKNRKAAEKFRKIFSGEKIEKYYLALSHKKGKKKQGTIKGHLTKGRNGNWRLESGKPVNSVTQFFSYGSGNPEDRERLFLVRLIGGKTHQIRVALKANASPILGDRRYGGHQSTRLMLHAYALCFEYNGDLIEAISQPDFLTQTGTGSLPESLANPGLQPWPKIQIPSIQKTSFS